MPKTTRSRPWNQGKAVGQMRPFTPDQVRTLKHLLAAGGNLRDLALLSTALDTMLRGGDLLALTVADVTDHHGRVLEEIRVRQQKTGHGTLAGLTPSTRQALERWIAAGGKGAEDPLFTGRRRSRDKALTTAQLRRLVKSWAVALRLDPRRYSSHSLRRTKAALVFEHTRNVEVVRELLGQKSVSATSAYLNIGRKRALDIALRLEL